MIIAVWNTKIITSSTYENRTDQSLDYQTELSMPSQGMMTTSSTCNSLVYSRSNPETNVTSTRPNLETDKGCERSSLIHNKRRLNHVGSNTFSSCSTNNVSQSSTLTEISLMDNDDDINIILIDDITPAISPPEFVSGNLLYDKGADDTNDCTPQGYYS